MIFHDVVGEPVQVANVPAHCLQPPLNVYAKLIALTIQEPQEIWYEWTAIPIPNTATVFTLDRAALVRRYIASYDIESKVHALTIVTTIGPGGWEVRDVAVGEDALAAARCGNLAYRAGIENTDP
jgi:phage-Barnase-EndoU-ColicinE5/D-RelE like nuclease2